MKYRGQRVLQRFDSYNREQLYYLRSLLSQFIDEDPK